MKYFQWLDGDKIGKIVKYVSTEIEDGELYLSFSDGSRCNRNYVALLNEFNISNKYISHISGLDNAWDIYYEEIPEVIEKYDTDVDGVRHCVQPYEPSRKIKRVRQPKFYHIQEDEYETFDTPTINSREHKQSEGTYKESDNSHIELNHVDDVRVNELSINNVNREISAIEILCEKAKKVESEFNVSITVNIPHKSFYDVIDSSFENGGDDVINYIMEHINSKDVYEAIKTGLTSIYKTEESIW